MRGRIGTPLCWMLVAVLGTGCDGDESVQGPLPPPPPRPTILDYRPIAGHWAGRMSTPGGVNSSNMDVSLDQTAPLRGKIGTVFYSGWNCGMDLHALEAEPPNYLVEERYVSGPVNCAEGLGILEHDPEAGTLVYKFVNHDDSNDTGTATLARQ